MACTKKVQATAYIKPCVVKFVITVFRKTPVPFLPLLLSDGGSIEPNIIDKDHTGAAGRTDPLKTNRNSSDIT